MSVGNDTGDWRHLCRDAGCEETIELWRDVLQCGTWIQHGDSPESRRFIQDVVMVQGPMRKVAPRVWYLEDLADWLDRVHEYEMAI